jgi:NAD(P)-dependent dehydrogenase (short-subunit alcohol dehydrogenase family)
MADFWAGRGVIITGAAAGIGRAAAERLHARGAKLALIDQDADGVEAAARTLGAAWAAGDTSLIDVAHRDMTRAAEALGSVDAVLHTPHLPAVGRFAAVSLHQHHRTVFSTLGSALNIAHSAFPHLRKTGGMLVLVTGDPAPDAGHAAYDAAYAGVIALGRALAAEWAGEGVAVGTAHAPLAPQPDTAVQLADRVIAAVETREPLIWAGGRPPLATWLTRLGLPADSVLTRALWARTRG